MKEGYPEEKRKKKAREKREGGKRGREIRKKNSKEKNKRMRIGQERKRDKGNKILGK